MFKLILMLFLSMLHRFDSEDEHEPEKLHLQSQTNPCTPVEGQHNESTKTEEPNTSQPGPTQCKSGKKLNLPSHSVSLISYGSFHS